MTISNITTSQTKDPSSSSRLARQQMYRHKRSLTQNSRSSSTSLENSEADANNILSAETHRRRHSRKKQASFSRLSRQLNATNTTEPGYATVYAEDGKLPQFGEFLFQRHQGWVLGPYSCYYVKRPTNTGLLTAQTDAWRLLHSSTRYIWMAT